MKRIILFLCFSSSMSAFAQITLTPLSPRAKDSSKIEVQACSVNFYTKFEGEYLFLPWVAPVKPPQQDGPWLTFPPRAVITFKTIKGHNYSIFIDYAGNVPITLKGPSYSNLFPGDSKTIVYKAATTGMTQLSISASPKSLWKFSKCTITAM